MYGNLLNPNVVAYAKGNPVIITKTGTAKRKPTFIIVDAKWLLSAMSAESNRIHTEAMCRMTTQMALKTFNDCMYPIFVIMT